MRSIRVASLLLWATLAGCPDLPKGPRYDGAGHTEPQRGGTLMLWEEARVRMLDPHVAFDQISAVIIEMLYDGLYRYDRELKMVPSIAEALPEVSPDGRTFMIPIRRGVRFHNGRELDARDVLWSLERMLHPDLQSPGAQYFSAIDGFGEYQEKKTAHVRGLSTPDLHTLRVVLARADQSFVYALAMRFASPVAREEIERKDAQPKRRPVGTGPFRLESWDPGVRLVLKRFDRYWRPGRPYLDAVIFEEGLKRDTAMMRFRNGDLDIAPRVGPADAMLLRSAPWRPYMQASPRMDTFGVAMNVQMWPFDNVHVRRAVAAALDRERWARARNGMLLPTGQLIPPKVGGYDPALPHRQRFDLAQARHEMKLAGYPDGLPEPVTLWTTDGAAGRAYFELLHADLSKIGIELTPKSVSFPIWLEETGKPRTAQMSLVGWGMDFPDASNILALVSKQAIAKRDSMNRAFFSDEVIEQLLARATVEPDEAQRNELYRKANDRVAELAPWAFHSNTVAPQAWQPYVKGYAPHPLYWIDVTDVWLDLPRKRLAALRAREPAAFALLGGRP